VNETVNLVVCTRLMVEQLEKVDPRQMTHEQKLAFWINIYNALVMHVINPLNLLAS
jgi:hypothetical protein